jgi:hypothetical protein
MPSPITPCPTCAGSGRVVSCSGEWLGERHRWGDAETAPEHVYWCRACRRELLDEDGEPADRGCNYCTDLCSACHGVGVEPCDACGEVASVTVGGLPMCAACAPEWRSESEADAHAERCSQLAAWCDGIGSAPALESRRARRVAA